jgi:uncharacterized protein
MNMVPPTYSTKPDEWGTCNTYTNDLRLITSKYLEEITKYNESIKGFMHYENKLRIQPRHELEHQFDFLMMGLYWILYSKQASKAGKLIPLFLSKLNQHRNQSKRLKWFIDSLRGLCIGYLSRKVGKTLHIPHTTNGLMQIILFLEAIGDHEGITERLVQWHNYLYQKDQKEARLIIRQSLQFGQWFIDQSRKSLGEYTKEVSSYRQKIKKSNRFREDYMLRTRPEADYHLNMLGSAVFNMAFKDEFENTSQAIVLLPGCLRSKDSKSCNAIPTSRGLKCRFCSSTCTVSNLTRTGIIQGYEVSIIEHGSSMQNTSGFKKTDGIIGVACVPSLITGGLKVKSMGLTAQCVALNCSGCKTHWTEQKQDTSLDHQQLQVILNSHPSIRAQISKVS